MHMSRCSTASSAPAARTCSRTTQVVVRYCPNGGDAYGEMTQKEKATADGNSWFGWHMGNFGSHLPLALERDERPHGLRAGQVARAADRRQRGVEAVEHGRRECDDFTLGRSGGGGGGAASPAPFPLLSFLVCFLLRT